MKIYDSTLWGKIDEPESFIELIALITSNKTNGLNVSYWRGQANIQWQLFPSIVRKIKLQPKMQEKAENSLDRLISYWEAILLSEAEKNLYNYDERGRKLSDIELLAKLQHHGAATRLLDFSKNALIALWFCISDVTYQDETGFLLGINTDIIAGMENSFNFSMNYNDFFDKVCQSNNIWMIDVPAIVSRVSAQSSVFLCSRSTNEKYGSFMLPSDGLQKKMIALSPKLKKECIRILSGSFNITPFTIFPDIEGFANAHSSKWKIGEFTRW